MFGISKLPNSFSTEIECRIKFKTFLVLRITPKRQFASEETIQFLKKVNWKNNIQELANFISKYLREYFKWKSWHVLDTAIFWNYKNVTETHMCVIMPQIRFLPLYCAAAASTMFLNSQSISVRISGSCHKCNGWT